MLATGALAFGGLVLLGARALRPVPRAVVFGAVSGELFAVVAVLIDVGSGLLSRHGVAVLARPAGLVPLVGVAVLGTAAMTVTQLAFQIGELGASFPTTLVVDPVVAVVLGAVVLGERLPHDPAHLFGYLVAMLVVTAATIVLANPRPAPARALDPMGRR